MAASFTILASGSGGNASLLELDGFGLLIDFGLAPRTLSARLAAVGRSWANVHAVLLTHTHGDHWKNLTLAQFASQKVPLYAHENQLSYLNTAAEAFEGLHRACLTRTYRDRSPTTIAPGLSCLPVSVPHDSDPTFAFRIDYRAAGGDEAAWSLGYASDLGHASNVLADAFANVDVLALEYNHDERMQRNSARPAALIDRVLGNTGHLSNRQAADLTYRVASRPGMKRLATLVQLHLSRECNTPALAAQAAYEVFHKLEQPIELITARQDAPSNRIPLPGDTGTLPVTRSVTMASPAKRSAQLLLPGFDE